MTDKQLYAHLESTLTHTQICRLGYAPWDGPDGIVHFVNSKDAVWLLQEVRDKARNGTFPQAHRFGGSRLEPVYFLKSEVARWLDKRYSHTDDAPLVKKAEKAGFIIPKGDGIPPTSFPTRKSQRPGDCRKGKKSKVKMPVMSWDLSKGSK